MTILSVIGKDVNALALKKERTPLDADVLSKYGRLVLLVTREQRVSDEEESEDMSDSEITEFLVSTVGVDAIKQSLKNLGVL